MVPEPYEGSYGPPERLVFLLGEASYVSDTIFDESGRMSHVEVLGNGRKTWMVLECLTTGAVFLNVVEERWGSGFLIVGSGRILASWT